MEDEEDEDLELEPWEEPEDLAGTAEASADDGETGAAEDPCDPEQADSSEGEHEHSNDEENFLRGVASESGDGEQPC